MNNHSSTQIHHDLWTKLLLFSCVVFFSINFCSAQTKAVKVKKDEDVRVLMNKSWHDGMVVDIKGKQILVEYDFNGNFQRGVFSRKAVRLLCEVEAMDFCRRWRTASGKSTVQAALKEIKGEKVLLVRRDMKEVTVPLDKLSKPDVSYVKRMKKWYKKTGGGGVNLAGLPEIEDFGDGAFGESGSATIGTKSYATFGDTEGKNQLHRFGSEPECFKHFVEAGVGFKMTNFFEKLRAVIPVGGKDQLVLAVGQESLNSKNNPSQLYWISFKQKKVIGKALITPSDIAIDYHPEKHLLLSYHSSRSGADIPAHLTLWKLEPGAARATPLVRFQTEIDTFFDQFFGKVIDEKTILVGKKNNTYTCFNIEKKEIVYEFKPESFFKAKVTLSPDRKHLISPEDGFLTVYNAVTGEPTARVSTDGKNLAGARVNPAGDKLAAISASDVYVWDLKKPGSEPQVLPAPLIGSPFKCRIDWIGNEHILGESLHQRVLYSLRLKLPVWTYKMNVSDGFTNRNPLMSMVVNGLFFYVAKPQTQHLSFGVGAVELPGPKVMDITKDVARDDLLLIKPGTKVRIDTSGITSNTNEIRRWLENKATENKWVVDENASVVLKGMMGIGASQTVEYHESSFGFRSTNGRTQTVTFRPHWAKLRLVQDGYIIWQTATSTGAPSFIRGRNIQQKVQSYQTPRVRFFERAKVPGEIIDPKYGRGFGVSSLGLHGIKVVSTQPPGRDKNPFQAEMDADAKLRDEFSKERENQNSGTGGALTAPGAEGAEPPSGRVQDDERKRRQGGRSGLPPGGFRGGNQGGGSTGRGGFGPGRGGLGPGRGGVGSGRGGRGN